MIKRTDSETNNRRNKLSNDRKKADRNRRRRLMMEGLETRQLLDGSGFDIDPDLFAETDPRNIGSVPSFVFLENEAAGERGVNDGISGADFIPLGTGPGQEDTIDITGNMNFTVNAQNLVQVDVDVFAFDLRAGDILDIATLGSAGNITVMYEDGRIWWGTDTNTAVQDPTAPASPSNYGAFSPLQTLGVAAGAQVVPADGRYYLHLSPSTLTSSYTAGLRVYRPRAEQLPIGAQQVIYVDFDGGIYPASLFPFTDPLGVIRFTSIEENLGTLGFINPILPEDVNGIIDYTINELEDMMDTLGFNGTNGHYDLTGTPGEYGVKIRHSRDGLPQPNFNDPLVTRVFIGSETDFGATGLFGISQSLDVGNFNMSEVVLAAWEPHVPGALQFPLSPSVTQADAISQQLAGTIAHEVGHSFGIWHTDGNNLVDNLMDEGSASLDAYSQGIGIDGIFGTSDDVQPGFNDDRFSPTEGLFFGTERVPAALSWVLSTGTCGSTIRGNVFSDNNRNGVDFNEPGLAGVTVYADANNNGVQDPTDPTDVTDASGNYSLLVGSGNVDVHVIPPAQFIGTTPLIQPTTAGATGVDFGLVQVIPDVTGFKFADNNGNGLFDDSESGLEGVFIYLDLDNDDRPDLGEPSTLSESDGSYSLNFPGPGTYTIREVVEPGFIQTFPSAADNGEHIVVFDGVALGDNYNFGNLPSRDYGDAPDSYSTLDASGGPSHGITVGIGLGANIDREIDGQPNDAATGDDADISTNDEDGVEQLTPLGPGATTTFRVDVRNDNASPAYLQGWIDFNADGDFTDAGEQVFTNLELAGGSHDLDVAVPSNVAIGTTYARFRYSTDLGLGVGGAADDGEVEDYQLNVQNAAELLNDDAFTVSRNSQANQLFLLENDFETPFNQLEIAQVSGGDSINGTVVISQDRRSVFYTPRNNFVGLASFLYTVRDSTGNIVVDGDGNQVVGTVTVNVTFQSAVPIALDDTFEIPEGSNNRALNVLDNDVPSVAGGIRITTVTGGDQGGTVIVDGGGQTIRYTPAPGFRGTEQFMYGIQDQAGVTSFAEVTVNMLPGSRNDDLADFQLKIFDTLNDREITDVQVGDEFNLRVFVDDLRYDEFNRPFGTDPEGLAAAFLDVLYTDELVATVDSPGLAGPFDITYGPLFEGGFALGDSTTPGLLDEVGAVQPIPAPGQTFTNHEGLTELFTVRMSAVSPGVAIFTGDPADDVASETVLLGTNVALDASLQRLGRTTLTIRPTAASFPSAIDDSFPIGLDSNGDTIANLARVPAVLDVLANDNFGVTGRIREFGIATAPTQGSLSVNQNGSPLDPNDDFIEYTPNVGVEGFDSFTYIIVTDDDIRSTAEVTMAFGQTSDDDDLVRLDFNVVDAAGAQITPVAGPGGVPQFPLAGGQEFGLQVIAEDLRVGLDQSHVFAAFQDILYDSGLISVIDSTQSDRFDFDVTFAPAFSTPAGVGTAVRPGLIDEFGSVLADTSPTNDQPARNLLATIKLVASNVSQTTTTNVVGGPADASPFQDTLLFERQEPVPVDQISYDTIALQIVPSGISTNSTLPADVNNSGRVTALDAIMVVNNLKNSDALGEGEGVGGTGVYYDVNGDRRITALDALLVIEHIRQEYNSANGVAEAEQVFGSGAGPISVDNDQVFSGMSGKNVLVSGGGAENGLASAPISGLEDSSDEEDDVISVLADDLVSQQF